MEKLRGKLKSMRAQDGKLSSLLEWPKHTHRSSVQIKWTHFHALVKILFISERYKTKPTIFAGIPIFYNLNSYVFTTKALRTKEVFHLLFVWLVRQPPKIYFQL